VDSRIIAAALLAAVTAVVVLSATRPPETTDVLVAAAPAAAGTRVSEIQVTTRAVTRAEGLVVAAELKAVADHVLLVDLGTGSPLITDILSSPDVTSATDVIGLELSSDAAVHGILLPGDSVDLYLTTDPGDPVAIGVAVVGVFADSGTLGTGDVGVLLAVDDEIAPIVVRAAAGDAIYLVRRGD